MEGRQTTNAIDKIWTSPTKQFWMDGHKQIAVGQTWTECMDMYGGHDQLKGCPYKVLVKDDN